MVDPVSVKDEGENSLLADLSAQPDIQLVTFFLDGEEYGIDVMQVREIIGMVDITKTANAPYHVEGIINLRGSIVPVISLRKRLGMPDLEDATTSLIAVMDFSGTLTGFVIDEISDVARINYSDIVPAPDSSGQPWISGIHHKGERLVVVVNLQSFLQE